jgi:transposase InsO family protein
MSKVLKVSLSGFYKWLSARADRKRTHNDLDRRIKNSFDRSQGTYGSPRIADDLKKGKINVSKTTIARRMQVLNLTARPKKKFVITTNSVHDYEVVGNVLNREFNVDQLNRVWVSDITYIRVSNYWMYLTVIIDLADRMVVGWSLSRDMTSQNTVIKAFNQAVIKRGITKTDNLMFHSDRGVQYACLDLVKLLNKLNCTRSMSRKANCWDNAVAESFFKTIKVEKLYKYIFQNQNQLYNTLFRYIDGWYNTKRMHSNNNGKSPLETFKLKSLCLAA